MCVCVCVCVCVLTCAQEGIEVLDELKEVEEDEENSGAKQREEDDVVPHQVVDAYTREGGRGQGRGWMRGRTVSYETLTFLLHVVLVLHVQSDSPL